MVLYLCTRRTAGGTGPWGEIKVTSKGCKNQELTTTLSSQQLESLTAQYHAYCILSASLVYTSELDSSSGLPGEGQLLLHRPWLTFSSQVDAAPRSLRSLNIDIAPCSLEVRFGSPQVASLESLDGTRCCSERWEGTVLDVGRSATTCSILTSASMAWRRLSPVFDQLRLT